MTGQSFVGIKRCTVPNQSLSLREILKRFVRREPLPLHREGSFEERFGDLEKVARADITVQMEEAEKLRSAIAGYNKRVRDKNRATADALFLSSTPSVVVSPVGEVPVKSPT